MTIGLTPVGFLASVANFAKYPAVNWFSYYPLRDELAPRGFACFDRFDMIDTAGLQPAARRLLGVLRAMAPLRWLGHVATPYTLVIARKNG